MAINRISSTNASYSSSSSSGPDISLPNIVMSNDWMTQYLTPDDYKLASAVTGTDIHPDADGHLGLVPGELEIIASARKNGTISATQNAPAGLLQYFGNADFSKALGYIAQRDAELAAEIGTRDSSESNSINYLA